MAKIFVDVATLMPDGGQGFTLVWAGTADYYTDDGIRYWTQSEGSLPLGTSSPQTYNTNITDMLIAALESEHSVTVAQNDKIFITGKKFY